MKKGLLLTLIVLLVFFTGTAFIIKSSTGISGQTGSPGEGLCNDCHGGGFSLSSAVTISATPSFTNNEYLFGQTYTISITVAASTFNNFGFGCEILKSSNASVGTMQNAGSGVKFLNAFNGRRNAVHTTPKSGSGSATFKFEWVAPLTEETIKIYAAGNCVNLDGNTTGDYPIQANITLTASPTANIKESSITVLSGFNVYPNPSSDKINFTYQLKDEGMVSVELISINGQQIASLLNEKQSAGLYQKSVLIPNTVAPGVYFIKASFNNQKISQRLITVN